MTTRVKLEYAPSRELSNQEVFVILLTLRASCRGKKLTYLFGYKTGVFSSQKWLQITKSVLFKFCYKLSFLNNLKDLGPRFLGLFWKEKNPCLITESKYFPLTVITFHSSNSCPVKVISLVKMVEKHGDKFMHSKECWKWFEPSLEIKYNGVFKQKRFWFFYALVIPLQLWMISR